MINEINIFSNTNLNSFISQLMLNYKIISNNINKINLSENNQEGGIIFLSKQSDLRTINLNNLRNEYLILTNLNLEFFSTSKNLKFVRGPLSVNNFRNHILNYIVTQKIKFHDIEIVNKKITNTKNNSSCYLTDIENEICHCLIGSKVTTKSYIKKNILKIKSNIETNSLDSHLTRIRKKFQKINSSLKINSKNDELLISIN